MRFIHCLCQILLACTSMQAVSIAELARQNKLPQPYGYPIKVLNLSNLDLTSLARLKDIPGIEQVQVLVLNNNNLTIIPAGSFTALPRLQAVSLINNNITVIEPGAFDPNIRVILVNGNKLGSFEAGTFADLKKLWLLSLGNNPLSREEMKELSKQLPGVFFARPLNRKNLQRAGIIAAAIGLAALAVMKVKQQLSQTTVVPEIAIAEQNTNLIDGAFYNNLPLVKNALDKKAKIKANINAQDEDGNTALIFAAQFGYTEIAEYLLKQPDIDVTVANDIGNDALKIASPAIKQMIEDHLAKKQTQQSAQ